jgi:diaminopimelate decarboxylase
MVTRVVADRTVAGRRMVHLDASGYSGLFESSFISPGGGDPSIRPAGGLRAGRSRAEVLGPIMDSFDVVKRDVPLPPLADGELLLLPNVGAYAWGYTTACEGVRAPEVVRLPEYLDAEFADVRAAEVVGLSGT